jgi:hypothetical protein
LGVYDGFSGFVTQPVQGWKKGGSTGMYKGIWKGIGGMLLKPFPGRSQRVKPHHQLMQTGVAGVVGLTFKGMYEEIQKKHGRTVDGHTRAMLIMQGYNEAKDLTAEERVSILGRWKAVEVKTGRRKK